MSSEPTPREPWTPSTMPQRMPFPPAPAPVSADDESGRSSEPELSIRLGDLLEGRYQIEQQIGEGGVGVVYRALQLKLHRPVAVKLLLQDTIGEEAIRPRFQQEALTLAAVSHPNIVSLQDYGMVRGRPFLVMEFLEGRTLRQIIDDGPLEPVRTLLLIRQLLLALAYAHELGVVHRDLKPANLIVLALPAYEHVKVLDFGMVKLLPHSVLTRGESLTRAGYTFGTPAYMSPEHAIGGDVDGRSDLYAVGVLLFEMLTGQKPYDGEVQDVLRHHLQSPIPRLEERRPELIGFPELQNLIDRAMAKEPVDRFANASEVLVVIDELLRSGLLADDASDELAVQDDGSRPSLVPRLRETLESAGAALTGYARSSRELFREKASPQLKRARRELRAAAARLSPKLRSLSQAAWDKLRPQLTGAALRVVRLASQTRYRIALEATNQRERSKQRAQGRPPPTLKLPSNAVDAELIVARIEPAEQAVIPGDQTVVDMQPDEQGDRAATLVLGQKAYSATLSEFGGHAGLTAEPLTLEVRKPKSEPSQK